jgi:hypothetical protein
VDTPLWVTVLASALTALGAYVAGVRPARIAARQAEADRTWRGWSVTTTASSG